MKELHIQGLKKKGVLGKEEGEESGTQRGGREEGRQGPRKNIYNIKANKYQGAPARRPRAPGLLSCLLGAIFIYFIKPRAYICDCHTFSQVALQRQ